MPVSNEKILERVLTFLIRDEGFAAKYLPLIPKEFFELHPMFGRVYHALRHYVNSFGEAPHIEVLAEWVTERDLDHFEKLSTAGNTDALDFLKQIQSDPLFDKAPTEADLDRDLRRLAASRFLLQAAEIVREEDFDPEIATPQIEALFQEFKSFRVTVDGPLPADWLLPSEVARARPLNGVRVRTGFPTLDRETRGGIPAGLVVITQGPPGAGKTAFTIQIGVKATRENDAAFVGVFQDEGRAAAAIRIGQNFGLHRDSLEGGDSAGLEKLDMLMESRDIRLPDPHDLGNTIDTVAERARGHFGPDRLIVYVVDNVQRVRCRAGDSEDSPRLRIDAMMNTLRQIASNGPSLVLAISEVNRGAYRNKKASENVTELAAAAESRAVEYGCDLLLNLSGNIEEKVRISSPKSRLGTKLSALLRFDRATATFEEIDTAEIEAEKALEQQRQLHERNEQLEAAILLTLESSPKISTRTVHSEVKGRASEVTAALRRLENAGLVVKEDGTRQSLLWSHVPGANCFP